MLLIIGSLLGRFGTIGKCTAIRGVSGGLGALLWLGLRDGLLGSTPSKNEVSEPFCLLVLSDLRDAFVAMQSGINCFDCKIASLGWAL